MKVLGVILVSLLFLGASNCGFGADIIEADIYDTIYSFNTDTVVLDNVIVEPDKLVIDGMVELENHGVIKTDVFLTDGTNLVLRNTGVVNANFDLGVGSVLYHKIAANNEIKYVDFNVNYTAFVESSEALSLTGIIDVTANADKVFVQNAIINIDGIPKNLNNYIELGDNVSFVFGDLGVLYEGVLLNDVRGISNVSFISGNQNPMFSDYGYIKGNKLYVGHVRATDYAKIYPNDLGEFLNSVRNSGKHDSLFLRLDNAMTYSELDSIRGNSLLFNPDKLFEPLHILNALNFADRNLETGNVGGEIFGFASDSFYAYGLGVNIGSDMSDGLSVYANLQIGTLDYQDDLDVFSGSIYGLNVGAKYLLDSDAFVRGDIGLLALDTDIDAVFYNNKEIKQPWVNSGYMNVDIGRVFRFIDDISLTPFAGVRTDYYTVDTYNDFKANLYVGTDVGFDTEFSGIKYFYSARGAFNTDMYFILNGKIGIWSVADAMGGDLSASISNTDDVISYKVALNTRVAF